MVELVKNEIYKDLMIEKMLREICLELSEVYKKREKEIEELEKRTGYLVSKGDMRMLKRFRAMIRRGLSWMSTPVFVDPESSTQADGAQSSRVPVPLPKDPYEAIRQAYFIGTNTKSKPFEGKARTPESPHIVALPTCHVEESEGSGTSGARSTSSNFILHRTARMVVHVAPVMSPGLSAGMAEVAAMPDLVFRKSKEVKESSDSDSESEDVEEEGPTAEDEDPATEDEDDDSHGLDDESYGIDGERHGIESDGLGLGEEGAVPEGQQRAVPVVRIAMSEPLGFGYGALRHRELALEEDHAYNTFEVGQGSGSAPELGRSERVSTSLEHEQERTAVTFGALWRLVLALEAWAGRVDTRMTDMSQARYDDHRLVHNMLLQQIALQRELQEMRDRVTVCEQERDRRER
nr:hypothetical protein [Tanacetum cinerariifolium]